MNALAGSLRSTFVTVLGWILLSLCALSLLSAVSQALLLETVTPALLQNQPPELQGAGDALSGVLRGMNAVGVVLTALLTYAAHAFIRRRNWARRLFLVLFAIGIVANVLGILMFGAGFGLINLAVSQNPSLPEGSGSIFTAMFVLYGLFAAATVVLLAWLIKRLRSPAVKAEFAGTRVPPDALHTMGG